MPVIISWISRHPPTDRQRAELARLFGPHELRTDTNPFSDAAEIKRRIITRESWSLFASRRSRS